MSIFDYTAALQITFDKEITNDPAVITGSEAYRIPQEMITAISSGDYSGYPKTNAFDGSATSYWRSSSSVMPRWIGQDFGRTVSLTLIKIYTTANYGPNAYTVQGSVDGSSWQDVILGNLANTTGWQSITFASTAFRYWQIYVTSIHGTSLRIYELEFWGTKNTYQTAGWSVSAQEYNHPPDGVLQIKTYPVRKLTRAEDHYSVILWLTLAERLKYPIGNITVHYNRDQGNLKGPQDSRVADFDICLAPDSIPVHYNPNPAEHINLEISVTTGTVLMNRYSYQEEPENLDLAITITNALIHINDLPQ